MTILNSTPDDLAVILSLYNTAIDYQKKVFHRHWQGFDRKMIEYEILENRQWKLVVNHEIVCIFAITFNDPLIWKERKR